MSSTETSSYTEALLSVLNDDRDELEKQLRTMTGIELNRLRISSDRLAMYVQRFIQNSTVFSHGNL